MLKATGFTIFAILLHLLFPDVFTSYQWLYGFFGKLCEIILVIAFVRLVDKLFVAVMTLWLRIAVYACSRSRDWCRCSSSSPSSWA